LDTDTHPPLSAIDRYHSIGSKLIYQKETSGKVAIPATISDLMFEVFRITTFSHDEPRGLSRFRKYNQRCKALVAVVYATNT
jgi:hypothetical protein